MNRRGSRNRAGVRFLLAPVLVLIGLAAPAITFEPVEAAFTAQTDNSGMSFVDNALDFDEIDDHFTVTDFDYASEFSIAFDFKLDSNAGSTFKYMYSHGNVNDSNAINVFVVESGQGVDPDVLRTVARDGNDTLDNTALDTNIGSLIGDGNWHTYVLAADSTNGLTVYVDGTAVNSDPTRGTDGIDPAGLLHVGGRQDLNSVRYYGGGLDTVQVYDRVLSPSEISTQAS